MGDLKKRRPILALIFSLVTPGLGQIYTGRFRKGLSYLVGFALVYLLSSFLLITFSGLILYLIIMVGFYIFILIDAIRGAKRSKEIALKPFNRWYIYLIILLVSNLGVGPLIRWTVKENIAQAHRIPSDTMAPTLVAGDHFIADKRIYKNRKPRRGDIIILRHPKDPSKEFIKRVIAIEGEKVEIIKNKIYINDRLMEDPWGHFTGQYPGSDTFGPVMVPKDSFFVLGDNRDNSMDSRHWGFVDIGKVRGRPLYLYWAKDKSRIGMGLK